MAELNAWNVPAGTKKTIKLHKTEWRCEAGAIEHKNRPEAVYIVLSTWGKPKLSLAKAKVAHEANPETIAVKTAMEFVNGMKASIRRLGQCFDSKYFDPHSIIVNWDYVANQVMVGKRQYIEVEINIDTVNTIGMDDKPSPNPANGKIEMYSFNDLEPHIAAAANKVLDIDVFNPKKSVMDFAPSKGAK